MQASNEREVANLKIANMSFEIKTLTHQLSRMTQLYNNKEQS